MLLTNKNIAIIFQNYMCLLKKIFDKYFWFISTGIFSLISVFSYGFIKSLFFWREDFRLIYSFFSHEQYYFWPYQGLNVIYYPFYMLFRNQPTGYFISALILYIVLAIILSIFVYKITKNKAASFLSGLIFSSGYIGSESMFMVMLAIVSNLYLILLLLLILIYLNFLRLFSLRNYLFAIFLYFLMVTLISHRAFSGCLIIFLTDLYWTTKNKKINFNSIRGSSVRSAPFFIVMIIVYLTFPLVFGHQETLATSSYRHLYQLAINVVNLNTWKDFGNFLIPTPVQDLAINYFTKDNFRTFIGTLAGGILFILAFGYIYFSKISKKDKKTLIYLFIVFIISFLPYHIIEYNFDHPSWHRYLLYGYVFYVALLGLAINNFPKVLGLLVTVVIVSLNIYWSNNSELADILKDRSAQAPKFFLSLKEGINLKNGKSLIYLDSIDNPKAEATLNSLLASGVFPSETALAAVYNQKLDNFKIVETYEDFIREQSTNHYSQISQFFYDANRNLTKVDSGEKIQPQVLSLASDNRQFSTYLNNEVSIDTDNFSSIKPVQVQIVIRSIIDPSKIQNFPYQEKSSDLSNEVEIKKIVDNSKLDLLLQYIKDREGFRRNARVTSNGEEYPGKADYSIDGNLETSWFSKKKLWVMGGQPYLQINLPSNYLISEVRWICTYPTRIPLAYRYEVSNDGIIWRNILEKNDPSIKSNRYVVDQINPIKTRYFRMVILSSSGDFPAISEIELLNGKYYGQIDSNIANYFYEHPFTFVKDYDDLQKIISLVSTYSKFRIYPISDKYPDQLHSIRIDNNLILDSSYHLYTISLPSGGTKLKKLLIEFPDLPIKGSIESVTLNSL